MKHFLRHSLEIWDSLLIVILTSNDKSQTCKICFYQIRDFRRIRKYLSPEVAKSVACALVTSHLDYCNSLLYNLPERDIKRLQWVQNCLAHVVCKASRFSRSKPLLYFSSLATSKITHTFELCTITFKAFVFLPTYISLKLFSPTSKFKIA